MSRNPASTLQDAKTWRDPKQPDPSPERQRYDTAVLKRDAVGKRLREWAGARSGPQYDALTAEWRAAASVADTAYDAMIAAHQEQPE